MTKGGWIGGRLVSEAIVAPNFFSDKGEESELCTEGGAVRRSERDGRVADLRESHPTGDDRPAWYVNAEEEDVRLLEKAIHFRIVVNEDERVL